MKRAAAILGFLLVWVGSAEARTSMMVDMKPEAAVKMTVGSCFDSMALAGYTPLDVTVNNASGQTRQWVLRFTSPGSYYGAPGVNTLSSSFTVTAENNGTRTVTLMVPTNGPVNGQMPLNLQVTGYGAESSLTQSIGGRSWSGKPPTPFVAISESLGTGIWSQLSNRIDSEGSDLMGSTFNPDDLPEDWRGLSGVSGLWLTGDELARLSAAQRSAILTWVHAGGRLMLYGLEAPPADFRFPGFGQVHCASQTKIDMDDAQMTIASALPHFDDSSELADAPQSAALTQVAPNVPLLFGVTALFAVVVGPVNLFVLARRRRERLFWTTPLISVAASALMMGMIVFQDGLGGHGVRTATVCIFPESRSEVVIQEQLSRSGLLLGSRFQTADPICMRQLDILPAGFNLAGRELTSDGQNFGGDWFSSRAAQAQRIVAVTPTRAEITLINAADVRDKGAAPIIVSSFAGTLDSLIYTDNAGRRWVGRDIQTGQKAELQPSEAQSNPSLHVLEELPSHSVLGLAESPGYFLASALDGPDYVATLDSIHWQSKGITYVGPVTATP